MKKRLITLLLSSLVLTAVLADLKMPHEQKNLCHITY